MADLMCDVIRNLFRLCKASFEYSLIGKCAGHVTRFLQNYNFTSENCGSTAATVKFKILQEISTHFDVFKSFEKPLNDH